MIDLNSKLEIPSGRVYSNFIIQNNQKTNKSPIQEPESEKVPPQRDPVDSDVDKTEEPPLSQEDKLDPSNNPMEGYGYGIGGPFGY